MEALVAPQCFGNGTLVACAGGGLDNPIVLMDVVANLASLLFIFMMSWYWARAWRGMRWRFGVLAAPFLVIEVFIALFWHTDLALIWAFQNYGNPGIVPYSTLWFALNPLWTLDRPYMLQTLCFELLGIIALAMLYRGGRIGAHSFAMAQATNIAFALIHNPQSLLHLQLLYAAQAYPPLLIAAAVIKLPLGWWPILANPHVACALGQQSTAYSSFFVGCLRAKPDLAFIVGNPTILYNWFCYAVQLAWGGFAIHKMLKRRGGAYRSLRIPGERLLRQSGVAELVYNVAVRTNTLMVLLALFRVAGVYEREVVRAVRGMRGLLFVDVGCNTGFYTRLLKANFAEVVGVDPNPRYRADLQVALAHFDGWTRMAISSDAGSGDSIMEHFQFAGRGYPARRTARVRVRRFDSLFSGADLVKIDVEGAEFLVLEGMSGSDVANIVVELHDPRREAELVSLLQGRGYSVSKLDALHFLAKRGLL